MSPEFRAGVEALEMAIRIAAVAQGDLDIGTYWTALHELAKEILLSDKGEEQAEMYWSKLVEFSEWQMAQAQEEDGYEAMPDGFGVDTTKPNCNCLSNEGCDTCDPEGMAELRRKQ
jgi:hypothetical protein